MLTKEDITRIRMTKAKLPRLFQGIIEKYSDLELPKLDILKDAQIWIGGSVQPVKTEMAINMLRAFTLKTPVKYVNMLDGMNLPYDDVHVFFDDLQEYEGTLLLDNINQTSNKLFISKLYALLVGRHYNMSNTICTSAIAVENLSDIYGAELGMYVLRNFKFFKTRESK